MDQMGADQKNGEKVALESKDTSLVWKTWRKIWGKSTVNSPSPVILKVILLLHFSTLNFYL